MFHVICIILYSSFSQFANSCPLKPLDHTRHLYRTAEGFWYIAETLGASNYFIRSTRKDVGEPVSARWEFHADVSSGYVDSVIAVTQVVYPGT